MRTDIRLFHLDRFQIPTASLAASDTAVLPDALLTHGVDLAGSTVALDSRPHCRRGWIRNGPSEACCSAASTRWLREHGDLIRPHLFRGDRSRSPTSSRRCTRLLVGRNAAVRAARRGRSTSRCTCSRRSLPGGVDLGHTLVILEEGAEATLLAETAGSDNEPATALRRDRIARRARRAAAVRQLAELGARRLALRPSKGSGRSRRQLAMDDRRPRQPAGQGQSARGAGRRRRRRAGQRRDVHRRASSISLTTRCSITRRRIARATCSTRAACRITRGSCGAA